MNAKLTMTQKLAYILSLLAVLGLFAVTGFQSWGYDDEIYSFRLVENSNSISEVIAKANSTDIHPAGMYIINYVLLKILGNWHLVKAASALFAASFIWFFWYVMTRDMKSLFALIFSYIAVCLNPTLLLWCTSVRWYTYFTPLVCVIAVLLYKAEDTRLNSTLFWGIYFLTCVIMFHLNYISAIIIPVSFICMLYRRRNSLQREWKCITLYALFSVCLVAYQAYVLLTVHYANSHKGFLPPFRLSIGAGQNFLCGQAVVPVSAYGIILIAANIILFIVFLKNILKTCRNCDNNFLILSYVAMMLIFPGNSTSSGARNFSVLSPEMGIFLSNVFQEIRHKSIKIFILLAYAIGTAGGIYNVLTHTDTSKATYNMPYKEIIDYAETLDPERQAMFITDFSDLDYHVKKKYNNVTYVGRGASKNWDKPLSSWRGRIIAVRTHQVADNYDKYLQYLSRVVNGEAGTLISRHEIGKDGFAWFKRIINKDYPDYYAQVYFIDNGGTE
ncbi:MAG: hypothetical protein IJG65_09435 [Synergistaceae bacterium]|nr:hypothetical protein [Synergistaceae bacterium]